MEFYYNSSAFLSAPIARPERFPVRRTVLWKDRGLGSERTCAIAKPKEK